MQFFKRFRKVLWMGALTLVVSAFIPGGTSYAAASKSAHDLIQSIFNRVGLKYEVPKAKPETPSKGEGVNPAPAPAPTLPTGGRTVATGQAGATGDFHPGGQDYQNR